MDIFVAILIIAFVAAVAFAVVQRRRFRAAGLDRPHGAPVAGRGGGLARHDPMAAAVAEHARATDPGDVVVAEQRLRAAARDVASGLQADAYRSEHDRAAELAGGGAYAADAGVNGYDERVPAAGAEYGVPADAGVNGYDERVPVPGAAYGVPAAGAAYGDPSLDGRVDPATGERIDGYGDPADDPRYGDPRYEGRLAADYVPPPADERPR
ncbi:MAG: hypothetical protein QOJ35_4087 [Solirubrobacteraceae bacterium]|nr:hypothetical protein [Solirubrobacteraceae bacterium]